MEAPSYVKLPILSNNLIKRLFNFNKSKGCSFMCLKRGN